jgi:hypothetical protein
VSEDALAGINAALRIHCTKDHNHNAPASSTLTLTRYMRRLGLVYHPRANAGYLAPGSSRVRQRLVLPGMVPTSFSGLTGHHAGIDPIREESWHP